MRTRRDMEMSGGSTRPDRAADRARIGRRTPALRAIERQTGPTVFLRAAQTVLRSRALLGGGRPPKTAVIVSAVVPYPTSDGKRVVLKGLLEYLVKRLGASNVHYVLLADTAPTVPLPCVTHLIGRPTTAQQVRNVLRDCVFGRRGTMQEAMIDSPDVRVRLAGVLATVRPDLEIYDTLRLAQLVEDQESDARRVVYLDDLFSVRYKRMLQQMRDDPDTDVRPLGEFVQHIPGPMRRLGSLPAVYRPLLRFEGRRLALREAECAAAFDLGLLINAEEVQTLRSRAPHATVAVLPPLIPAGKGPVLRRPSAPVFVFLGLLSQPHNEDALAAFLRQAMPRALQLMPDLRLRIVGKGVSEQLEELARPFGSAVQLEGFVDDLDGVLATCTALVAPLRFGSGVKIKVVEAVGRGVPVLATNVAAEGISSRLDGQDGIVIDDDLRHWPEAMRRLTDPDVNSEMSASALRFYRNTYSTGVVHEAYDRLFMDVAHDDAGIVDISHRVSVG